MGACDTPSVQTVVAPPAARFETSPNDCETQVIPEEECNNPGGAYEEFNVHFDFVTVDPPDELTGDTYETEESRAPCPAWMTGGTTGQVVDPRTKNVYQFYSMGTRNIDWGEWYLLPASQAVYHWPPSPWNNGWWAGENITRGTSALVYVDRARAVCKGAGSVDFIKFYGVQIREDNAYRQTSSSDGSGGGGGGGTWEGPGGSTCSWEWVVLEVSYDDGASWEVFWEGYATACE